MNKKIFAIFAVFALVLSISAVSAFGLDSLFGGGAKSAENINLGGINFTIPEGFEEIPEMALNGSSNLTEDGQKFTIWSKEFINGTNVIDIAVTSYEGVEIAEDVGDELPGEKKTVKGINGTIYDDGNLKGFQYVKDGKVVLVSCPTDDLLEQVIIN